MYFKSLEMRGFKSFVDETKLTFENGVTVIVGPNGCGKSNIADAIRWVLGEQSAKTMRGAKMEDFIFNGSAGRKPTGYAEVSLTISNDNGAVSSHPFSEYEQITVTRKLYRNGDSEYLVNKVPCRLKDIVDIFLDTGINARALSIIENEQVARIVNSKPEGRKVFIDEAAGIMKFKTRRNAAMNKLEGSQQNLLRIQDILGELERQRNSLNRQAKKAERYKTYRQEIREQGLVHYAMEFRSHSQALDEITGQLELLREKEAGLTAEFSGKRNNLESLRAQIAGDEKTIAGKREEKSRALASMERNESNRELMARQVDELAESMQNATEEIEKITSQTGGSDEQISERKRELESIKETIREKIERTSALRLEMDQQRESLDTSLARFEEENRSAMKIMEEISSANDERSSIGARLEMFAARLEGMASTQTELARDADAISSRSAGLKERMSALEQAVRTATSAREQFETRLGEVTLSMDTAQNEKKEIYDNITRRSSRLESIEELESSLEGYGEAVRSLMKLSDEGDMRFDGIKGLLAKQVSAPPELETALACVLGPRLEAIITADEKTCAGALQALKNDKLGSAMFVTTRLCAGQAAPVDAGDNPSIVGRGSDLFRCGAKTPQSVIRFLEKVIVCRDIAGAMEVWRRGDGALAVVTLDGEVIDFGGFVSGGSGGSADIVSRKRVIEELRGELEKLDREKESIVAKCEYLARSRSELEASLGQSSASLRKLEIEALELKNELGKAEADGARANEAMANLKNEKEEIIARRDELTGRLNELDTKAETLRDRKNGMDTEREHKQEAIHQARRQLEQYREKLREEELEITRLGGRVENVNIDIKRLEGIKADAVARCAGLGASIRQWEKRQEEMERAIESLLEENMELALEEERLDGEVKKLGATLEEKLAHAARMETDVKTFQKELETVQPEISEMSLQKSEITMRIENTIEKADAEFNIPLEDLQNADMADKDPDEAQTRLNFLRSEINRIGDVNLNALEEFEQINQRCEFLKEQRDDLVTSIATLRKTIDNLNKTTKKMFMDTFETVSMNFQATFKRLFGGGHAEMRLVHEEGKPEPGVEIMVQPPGKKNQSISLLSAGEKAMTAIALLFAVFQARPSPFCLLDEIDAPLDEANVTRFRDMLEEMRSATQFIIITHSQKTMSFADRLYGVTQEEEGVSKILTVNLVDEREPQMTAA